MRSRYVVSPAEVIDGFPSLVDHARAKLLYNELAPLFDLCIDRDTEQEVAAVRSIIGRLKPAAARIVDFGCGVGRHSGGLAAAGYEVTGVDLSPAMLQVAQDRYQACTFHEGDFRTVRLGGLFDVAIIMWTTFNYLGSRRDVTDFLNTAAQHLVAGGLLVVDSCNFEARQPEASSYARAVQDPERAVAVNIEKSEYRRHNVATYSYRIRNRTTGEVTECVDQEIARTYSAQELKSLGMGLFSFVEVHGDYDLRPFDPAASSRIISVYRRRES